MFYFETLDKTLNDLLQLDNLRNHSKLFGGKIMVFKGDDIWILLVISKGS